MQQQILMIGGETDVQNRLELILTEEGYRTLGAPEALAGLRLAYEQRPDLIILILATLDVDGFEACHRLREMTDTPILLVAQEEISPEDIVKAFSLGADEYLTMPFTNTELVGRIRVCQQRTSQRVTGTSGYLFPAPSMVLDRGRHELRIDGQTVSLSPKELEVLMVLVRHMGHTLSPDAILLHVWGPEHLGEADIVKQYIYQLRQKIEPDPGAPRYLHTVRGEGYYFFATKPS